MIDSPCGPKSIGELLIPLLIRLGIGSPSKKRDALSEVRTPDKSVWSLRASDIYKGGETCH